MIMDKTEGMGKDYGGNLLCKVQQFKMAYHVMPDVTLFFPLRSGELSKYNHVCECGWPG